jgi:hypothetical protein
MPKARLWMAVTLVAAVVAGLALLVPRCGEERSAKSPSVAAGEGTAPWSPRRIAKFDMHTHVDPELALPVRGFLESQGIGRVVNLSGGIPGDGLEDTIATAVATGGFYVIFVNVSFDGIGRPGWADREVEQLERAKKMGARGVKIAKNLGLRVQYDDGRRVAVDDPVLDPLFDAMARLHCRSRSTWEIPKHSSTRWARATAHGQADVAPDVELREQEQVPDLGSALRSSRRRVGALQDHHHRRPLRNARRAGRVMKC